MNKLILFFILFPFLCQSQNWAPINANDIYNYQEANDNYITTSIRVDSFTVDQQDTIFYFNRTIKKCEGCSFSVEDSVLLVQQEDFLNLSFVKQADGTYLFSGETSFRINPFAQLDETWIFDETNNVEASIISVEEITLFDQMDSCKIILLSTNDTIKLSKNFGIIDFNYQNKHYSLMGIQTRNLGEIIPNWIGFHDFEIGDVFQYLGWNFGLSGFSNGVSKQTILDKVETADNIIYTVRSIRSDTFQNNFGGFEYIYSENIYENSYDKHRDFEFKSNFNNTVVFNEYWSYPCEFNDNQLLARPLYLHKDPVDNRVTLGTGKLAFNINQNTEGHYLYDIDSDTMAQRECYEDFYYVYKMGLGLVYNSGEVLDNSNLRRLIGYVKGGDTTGVITPDEDLLVSTEEIAQDVVDFEVYPNPVFDKFTIHFKNEIPNELQILSLDGRILKEITEIGNIESLDIDLQEWASGLYMIKARYDGYNLVRKVIKQQ